MLAGLTLAKRASRGSAGAAARAAAAGFAAGAFDAGDCVAWTANRPAGTAAIAASISP
jgi:hypothetical protein